MFFLFSCSLIFKGALNFNPKPNNLKTFKTLKQPQQHHADTDAVDRVDGTPVRDPALIEHLLYCCDLATMAYCPTKEAMCDAADIKVRALFVVVFFGVCGCSVFLCVPSLCLC